jgi:hypothetical protein
MLSMTFRLPEYYSARKWSGAEVDLNVNDLILFNIAMAHARITHRDAKNGAEAARRPIWDNPL